MELHGIPLLIVPLELLIVIEGLLRRQIIIVNIAYAKILGLWDLSLRSVITKKSNYNQHEHAKEIFLSIELMVSPQQLGVRVSLSRVLVLVAENRQMKIKLVVLGKKVSVSGISINSFDGNRKALDMNS